MAEFQTVAKASEISPGELTLVNVAGQDVVVANVVGAFFAFGNECTHVGGPLVEGELHGETVTCHWHASIFNIKTGQASEGPGTTAAPTYEVRLEDDEIQIVKP